MDEAKKKNKEKIVHILDGGFGYENNFGKTALPFPLDAWNRRATGLVFLRKKHNFQHRKLNFEEKMEIEKKINKIVNLNYYFVFKNLLVLNWFVFFIPCISALHSNLHGLQHRLTSRNLRYLAALDAYREKEKGKMNIIFKTSFLFIRMLIRHCDPEQCCHKFQSNANTKRPGAWLHESLCLTTSGNAKTKKWSIQCSPTEQIIIIFDLI